MSLAAMTATDICAALAALFSSVALGLRANMLKPHVESWWTPPTRVWLSLSALSVALGVAALSIAFGNHATGREMLVYLASAVSSTIMLVNLATSSASGDDGGGKRGSDASAVRTGDGEGGA